MPIIRQMNPLPSTPIQVANTGITTAQIFPSPVTPTSAFVLPVDGGGKLESKLFYAQATGWATVGGVSPTLNVTMFAGTSLTPGSNTILGAAGAGQSVTTGASYDWAIVLEALGSTKSGRLVGNFQIIIDGNYVIKTTLSNIVTALNFGTDPVLNLCVGVTFGVANAANIAQLNRFELVAD